MPHQPQAAPPGAHMGTHASAEALPHRTTSDRQERAAGSFATGPRPPGSPRADAGHNRYASAQLHPHPAAAAQARRLTRQTLTRWHLEHLADEVVTVASELAANAIKAAVPAPAALPAIIFAVHHQPGRITITVWDNGPGQPQLAHPGPDAENGRGLAVIDDLTGRNWGWWPTPHSGGKVVHATLSAPRGDEADRSC